MQEIFNRVSVRKFTEQKITKEQIQSILKAAMQAPSAYNQQPWEFLVIEDKAVLKKFTEIHPYAQSLLSGAAVGIFVLCAKNRLQLPEMAAQDLSAATQNILLAAVHLDLGAVWLGVHGHPERAVAAQKLFNLPDNIEVFSALAVGYPAENRKAQSRYEENRVHYEKY
ncbi:nitroreductase family protein [Candidatus Termititenax persephonae]|uniref:Nitroreductase family protein n=1 Tax=Candidatus Termititenax persephonae TaxID=2218525 RepID=A0A388THU1_9BACT|nr:nitroreductase family protein [Candidatus Termititenax persephonae]